MTVKISRTSDGPPKIIASAVTSLNSSARSSHNTGTGATTTRMLTGTGPNLARLAEIVSDLHFEGYERRNMKIQWLLCVILAGCAFGVAKDKTDVRDVTGCLSK